MADRQRGLGEREREREGGDSGGKGCVACWRGRGMEGAGQGCKTIGKNVRGRVVEQRDEASGNRYNVAVGDAELATVFVGRAAHL